jgi:hypothetical protein
MNGRRNVAGAGTVPPPKLSREKVSRAPHAPRQKKTALLHLTPKVAVSGEAFDSWQEENRILSDAFRRARKTVCPDIKARSFRRSSASPSRKQP